MSNNNSKPDFRHNTLSRRVNVPECQNYLYPTTAEVEAIKQLKEGEATADQQKLALKYIIGGLSRANDVLYISGKPDDTAFLNGRGFVGLELLKILKLRREHIITQETKNKIEEVKHG